MNHDYQALPPAAVLKRLMAFSYDLFILAALSMAYWAVVTAVLAALQPNGESPNYLPMQKSVFWSLGWIGVIAGFYWFFWMRGGQTVGMRAWRLKVISATPGPLTHLQCLLRILVAPIGVAAGGLGYWWCWLNSGRLAWQDLASGTRIVQLPKTQRKNAASETSLTKTS